jgi:hypothetical protein
MPSVPSRQAWAKHTEPTFDNVFVKQDTSLSIAQQPRQRSLPIQEWEIAQILALMFDHVESVEHRGSSTLPTR